MPDAAQFTLALFDSSALGWSVSTPVDDDLPDEPPTEPAANPVAQPAPQGANLRA